MPIDQPPSSHPAQTSRRAVLLFALLSVSVAAGVVAYAVHARRRAVTPAAPSASAAVAPVDAARVAEARATPHVVFRITALGPSYGRVGIVPVDNPASPPVVSGLSCDRVYANANEGLCLQASRGVFTTYRAVAFDRSFNERHTFTLAGAPSRTRLAAAAPLAASTVFVSGDSYAAGGFSTRTTLFDLAQNIEIGDLETFKVLQDGQPFKRQDFNFWGVTFADGGDRFYATLGTGGALNLVEGSISARTLTVIGKDVECPSLSPDGRRVVYKARLIESGRMVWRLRVLDLTTRAIASVTETQNVDDQAEWLDADHVLYALPREGSGSSDIWVARADGTGTSRVFVPEAFSPAVVRNR